MADAIRFDPTKARSPGTSSNRELYEHLASVFPLSDRFVQRQKMFYSACLEIPRHGLFMSGCCVASQPHGVATDYASLEIINLLRRWVRTALCSVQIRQGFAFLD
jgi:hypothetical protein